MTSSWPAWQRAKWWMTTPAPSPPTLLEPPAAPASGCSTDGARQQASRPACRRSCHLPGRMAHRGRQASFHARHAQRGPFVQQSLLARLRRSACIPRRLPAAFLNRFSASGKSAKHAWPLRQTLPACLAALLRRPRAAAVCYAMSAFSPCTEAEGALISETRMARLAPPATAGAPPGLCRPFHRTAARV